MSTIPARQGLSVANLIAARRNRSILGFCLLLFLVVALIIASLGTGAVAIPPERVFRVLQAAIYGPALQHQDTLIILNIRLPRTIMGLLVGGALAASGALMQGLFRNPLADPGLIGVSSGASLAAAATIVLGDRLFGTASPLAILPIGAFLGGLAATLTLYAMATRSGRTSISTMLLGGVALGAFTGALTGLLFYLSNDRQLRDLSFWSLGSLGGATWSRVVVVAGPILLLAIALPFLARSLNALALGEAEAFHLGFPVQRIKALSIVLVALAVGASVAGAGMIGFVGLVVPHLLRLTIGPDHRMLLPFSMLAGGGLLLMADIAARTLAAPAEVPIGIVTASIGAPFFLWLLLRDQRSVDR